MPLGPVESLSFAVVVGVSVDYIVHLSFAFKYALLAGRYYKSRAAFLARRQPRTRAPAPRRAHVPTRPNAPWACARAHVLVYM